MLIQEDTKLWRFQDLKVGFHRVFFSTSFSTLQQCWSDWHNLTVEKKKCLIHCPFVAFVPQSDTVILKKKPVLQRDLAIPSLLSNFLPLLHILTPFPQHTHTHTREHTCTSAASHWSCKLCPSHVYAPFLPTISRHRPITAKSITSLLERLILINC